MNLQEEQPEAESKPPVLRRKKGKQAESGRRMFFRDFRILGFIGLGFIGLGFAGLGLRV